MHVEDLLRLESLDLELLWGEQQQLDREITGVTATDLEDPTRFVRPGEVVLSGLVWWSHANGTEKVSRFVSALAGAGAAALLAGEETHGSVPKELARSCKESGIALIAVPSRTNFRAITEAVYLRQWGDLSRRPTSHRHALPENVRTELSELVRAGVAPDVLLDRALGHLGAPACYVLTPTGRTVARTPKAPALPPQRARELLRRAPDGITLRVGTDSSAYDSWHLYLIDAAAAPPRLLHETAEVLADHRYDRDRLRNESRKRAGELIRTIETRSADPAALTGALTACGLSTDGPFLVVSAATPEDGDQGSAADALAEALRHPPGRPFALDRLPHGEAVAVVEGGPEVARALRALWPEVHACAPLVPLHGGIGPAAGPAQLHAALSGARYARSTSHAQEPGGARVTAMNDLTTLEGLLAGIPADVRAAYHTHVLGPLADDSHSSAQMLRETLETFLAHNGSWARTAEALHLHVNTVHYRVQRIEVLTGRDLSLLEHKLDLYAALHCR
ncbi:PucR family transcriptional regulator ligand-binding domain-containing protein [Streptomyces sp. NBC_00083]|uniref:helix-turn-helix domain-containing protein n=1 Tax=Streptomyces sp. NBC_00083 TaxID=2975647 RepID=UPI00225BDDBE|nr:PucR family transcriptional regulator ligand-binding domain-containing protein [Streptomyces sp. NBC_00083]MCX5386841.1 PucR family transcriptional regulator [Streptomyces sp. NBC_00083]